MLGDSEVMATVAVKNLSAGRKFYEGKLGFKAGEGFRKWTPEQQAALRAKVVAHLKKARDA